ncbi:MAG: V-type ATP synthase subunit E [Parachlamydiales bacterium]|jgi:V/A-type H+-transporting ATPase subunit E
MPEIQNSKDKIQRICESLKAQTIEPAKQEAQEILENAHIEAKEVRLKAKEEAERIKKAALLEMEKQKKNLLSSLALASRQAVDTLKQAVEKQFFRENLASLIEKPLSEPKLIAQLVEALIRAIEKEGTETDFTLVLSRTMDAKKIAALLAQDVLAKVQAQGFLAGDFAGGVKIQLKDKNLTLDISEKALQELIVEYVRQDFRTLIFGL